jgi:XTP/dITP diphosphohydrolase
MTSLVIASRNGHKVEEIGAILGDQFRLLSLRDFPEAPPVVEDAPDFVGNAVKKARALARWMQGVPSLEDRVPGKNAFVVADDSGLEVEALEGAPGVHSARFSLLPESGKAGESGAVAGGLENGSDPANNEKLLRLLRGVPLERRRARFRCVLASIRVKPAQPTLAGQTFEGVCEGRIQLRGRGQGGFGYDPLFVPTGHNESFAELGVEVKNEISHRVRALTGFRSYLKTLGL